MTKEELCSHLSIPHLVKFVELIEDNNDEIDRLLAAADILKNTGADENTQETVNAKIQERDNLSLLYADVLEKAWGLSFEDEAILARYMPFEYDDLASLPETIAPCVRIGVNEHGDSDEA